MRPFSKNGSLVSLYDSKHESQNENSIEEFDLYQQVMWQSIMLYNIDNYVKRHIFWKK